MTTLLHPLWAKLTTRFPASGIAYGLIVALVLGVGCRFIHAPPIMIVALGLIVAAWSLWMEREALTAAPDGGRRTNIRLQLTAAYIFMTLVAIGTVSLGYFLSLAMHHR